MWVLNCGISLVPQRKSTLSAVPSETDIGYDDGDANGDGRFDSMSAGMTAEDAGERLPKEHWLCSSKSIILRFYASRSNVSGQTNRAQCVDGKKLALPARKAIPENLFAGAEL